MQISAESIYVVGDLHAEFPRFNKWLSRFNYPDVVLQTGDFGWWPHYHGRQGLLPGKKIFDQYGLRNKKTKIFWCDGNHENHDDLALLVAKHGRVPIEVQPNVFYCPRGSVVTINGSNVLFFGGATSIDKAMRVPGDSWWVGENIAQSDIMYLPDCKIDVVVSHCCPTKFSKMHWYTTDGNNVALDVILDKYKPAMWFFGHYHEFKKGLNHHCKWKCLSNIEGDHMFFKKVKL